MPAAFASIIVDALYILLADLSGVAAIACVAGMLALSVFCGAKVSAKILNRGIGK